MCGRRYIPPETKLLKLFRPNISKIVFLVSDKNVVFVFCGYFCFYSRFSNDYFIVHYLT